MQIYYPDLSAIDHKTRQLDEEQCHHCNQTRQLVSHGFIYKKRANAEPEALGKRAFCSNRHRRTGCGRTMQLYVSSIVPYLHYAGYCVVMFLLLRMKGLSIQAAYQRATGTADPRNAYRWVNKLLAQLSTYRSLFHQPGLPDAPLSTMGHCPLRWVLLCSAFQRLYQALDESLCATYQLRWQRSLL